MSLFLFSSPPLPIANGAGFPPIYYLRDFFFFFFWVRDRFSGRECFLFSTQVKKKKTKARPNWLWLLDQIRMRSKVRAEVPSWRLGSSPPRRGTRVPFLSSLLLFIYHLPPLSSPPLCFSFTAFYWGNWTAGVMSSFYLSSVLSVARMEGVLQGYFLEIRARGDNQIGHMYEYHYSIGWMGVTGRYDRNR